MTSWTLALWLSACTGTPSDPQPTPDGAAPIPTPTPVAFEVREPTEFFQLSPELPAGFPNYREAGANQFPLALMTGTFDLGGVNYPPKVDEVTDTFVLALEEVPNPKGAERTLNVVRALLPFPVATDDQTFSPVGMTVSVAGVEIPFSKAPAPQAKKDTWRITGKHLILALKDLPADNQVTVTWGQPRAILDRHDPKASKLPADKYVRYSVTLGQHTRHGLLLTAPSTARWSIRLPAEKPRFDTWLTMEQPPLSKPRSDGADAVLSVIVGDQTTEVARQPIEADARTYTHWQADLSPWAGQEVTVQLSVDPRANSTFDWCFFGSPAISGEPTGDVRRIVVIGLDTTRPDHMGFNGYHRDSTPELDRIAASSAVFDKAWAPAPRTRPSFRSATTGRRPLDAVNAKNIGEVFQQEGFATAGIVANPHLQPRFGFDRGFDTWAFDGRADAEDQVDDALAWLDAHKNRDTYLFLHFMDAHMIYDAPGEWRNRYVTAEDPVLPARVERQKVLAMMKAGELSDVARAQLEALHDGEMAYMSNQIGRFVAALDEMPGKTLVVVHSDHGEEFWDHGGFEHNHSLYDELVRAVLWVRPTGGLPTGQRIDAPATLADIAPTLYDFAGIKNNPGSDGRSLIPAIRGTADWSERPIPIGYLQYSHERWGVVYKGHKYVLHTGSGQEELYDLAADPAEKVDLAAKTDLSPWRQQMLTSHDVTAGPGWRVRVDLRGRPEPLTLALPEGVREAGVLDPETVVEHRANIEWGERPRRLPGHIGTATLSDDKRTLSFTPGPDPEGILYVVFTADQTPQAAQLTVGGAPASLEPGKNGRVWKDGDRSIVIDPGFVVVPPATEADRMGLGGPVDKDTLAQLCSLGYVEDGCDEL